MMIIPYFLSFGLILALERIWQDSHDEDDDDDEGDDDEDDVLLDFDCRCRHYCLFSSTGKGKRKKGRRRKSREKGNEGKAK